MLKGWGKLRDKRAFLIGLSHGNLDRLREDKPIVIDGSQIGLGFDVLIFAGETEESMAQQLMANSSWPDAETLARTTLNKSTKVGE